VRDVPGGFRATQSDGFAAALSDQELAVLRDALARI
jgi:hypothetical protein